MSLAQEQGMQSGQSGEQGQSTGQTLQSAGGQAQSSGQGVQGQTDTQGQQQRQLHSQSDDEEYESRGQGYQADQGQFSQQSGQGQSGGQQQSQQGGQGSQQQGAIYQQPQRPDEPLVVHAPSGPMPGKNPRQGTQQRSPEERDRARRFGFPPTRMLVLTDGSENAHRALEAALHFRRRNDSLFIVNAAQLMDETVEYDQTNQLLKDKGRKIIDEVTKLIHEREIGRWECACLPSKNPKEAVLDYAMKHNIEVIFLGSRGVDAKTGDFYPVSEGKMHKNTEKQRR